jgi:hypothetical protein
MDVITDVPKGWLPARMSIDGFGHSWRPVIPQTPTSSTSPLPIPYDAYGSCKWILLACSSTHTGTCAANTVLLAAKATAQFDKSIERLPIIQGVSRNKRAAKLFRDSKRAPVEEEEEEEKQVVEEESDSESETSSEEEDSEEEEEEEEEEEDETLE